MLHKLFPDVSLAKWHEAPGWLLWMDLTLVKFKMFKSDNIHIFNEGLKKLGFPPDSLLMWSYFENEDVRVVYSRYL